MAQDHSAVRPGATDSQIASGRGAHDMLHADSQGTETSREATEAINPSVGTNLESTTIESTPSAPSDVVEVRPVNLPDSSPDVLASGKHVEPCVTTANDTTKKMLEVNGKGEPIPGMTPNESIGMFSRTVLI
jgi:hypothetical protein